jgi:hypothetical protein
MKCPHCINQIHATENILSKQTDYDGTWVMVSFVCPACFRIILKLRHFSPNKVDGAHSIQEPDLLVRPRIANRNPTPIEVPELYARDYTQACLVLTDSPMASAALSRRCLQHIIREVLKIKERDLATEIQKVIDESKLPSDILENIDAIRSIGNFAAHPIKSNSSGEIVEVEPGEAEWNLDVLEMLFDNLFVAPELRRKKKEALNLKLKDAGKPEMK